MPRPGQGTGGSSRASSGHSPSARQSSGHRISTSSANRRPQSGMQGRSAGNFSSSSRNFRPSSPGFGNRSPLGGFGGYRSTPRRPILFPASHYLAQETDDIPINPQCRMIITIMEGPDEALECPLR